MGILGRIEGGQFGSSGESERTAAAFSGLLVGGPWEENSQWFGGLQRKEAGFDGSIKVRSVQRRG